MSQQERDWLQYLNAYELGTPGLTQERIAALLGCGVRTVQRRQCFGELVQVDTSIHDWFEGRGEQGVLISYIDDATSHVYRRFYPSDSTLTNLSHLHGYLQRYGRPQALYDDKASHFVTTRCATVEEQLDGQTATTQIGRALRELDIAWVQAHSPQAKGRVERSFQTAQDWLVKELRLAGISTIAAANDFLAEYDARVTNVRFTVAPACALDAHHSLQGHELQAVLSVQQERTITRDYCIFFDRQRYQIPKHAARAGMVGTKVTVEERLDGSRHFRWREHYLLCQAVPRLPAARGAAGAAPAGLRPPSATPAPEAKGGPNQEQLSHKGHTPGPKHPWKSNLQGAFRSQRQDDISIGHKTRHFY